MIDSEEGEPPEQLAEMARNLKSLVDRANDSVTGADASDGGDEALPPIAMVLGLTKEEMEEARAFGFL